MSLAQKATLKPSPTPEDLLASVANLIPAIAARRDEADRMRDLSAETILELSGSGLFRVLQPARWGGFECDPRTVYALQNALAEVCPSTAWVYGVLSVQSFMVGRLEDRVQEEVWGQDATALICSSSAPVGKARATEGGFHLSGRWTFASGSTFADWALVGGKLVDPAPDAKPQLNLFLIPKSDYAIKDVWNTFGLKGTGSNDLVADDIFVPAHRHIRVDPGLQNLTSATGPATALYRLPWNYMFASTVSNFAIGAARGALRAFVEVARNRVSPFTGKAAKDDPLVAQAVAHLASELVSAEAMFDRHVTRQFEYIARDEVMPMRETWLCRIQLTSQLRTISALLDQLVMLQGSRATDMASHVTRAWLDLAAARTHLANDPTSAATMLGGLLIGEGAG